MKSSRIEDFAGAFKTITMLPIYRLSIQEDNYDIEVCGRKYIADIKRI